MRVLWFERIRSSKGRALGWTALRLVASLLVLGMPLSERSAEAAWPAPLPDGEPDLTLLWSDQERLLDTKLLPWGRVMVEREIREVFVEAGIHVKWAKSVSDSTEAAISNVLFIVIVPRRSDAWGLRPDALGAVIGDHPRMRSLYVFFPNLLAGIGDFGPETKRIRGPGDRERFSRAIARVVAHEVVHAIDPKLQHSDTESIMSEHLTPEMMQRERLALSRETAERLRVALLEPPPQAVTRTADCRK